MVDDMEKIKAVLQKKEELLAALEANLNRQDESLVLRKASLVKANDIVITHTENLLKQLEINKKMYRRQVAVLLLYTGLVLYELMHVFG